MEKYLADTHAIIWYVEGDSRLGPQARVLMKRMEEGEALIFLSVISLFEIDYLIHKKKVSDKLPELLLKETKPTNSALQIVGIDLSVYHAFREVPAKAIPELPDRILAATALSLSCPIITKDSKITQWKGLEAVW
ncbi:MAG: type II toxin-antitoxin system VapC family toxin [Deltaproteobacteria bacterium]|nr:type II toxin-antitoxin system VapC family toxin [Deltaproteobacteria bacterium]